MYTHVCVRVCKSEDRGQACSQTFSGSLLTLQLPSLLDSHRAGGQWLCFCDADGGRGRRKGKDSTSKDLGNWHNNKLESEEGGKKGVREGGRRREEGEEERDPLISREEWVEGEEGKGGDWRRRRRKRARERSPVDWG